MMEYIYERHEVEALIRDGKVASIVTMNWNCCARPDEYVNSFHGNMRPKLPYECGNLTAPTSDIEKCRLVVEESRKFPRENTHAALPSDMLMKT
jgi:hypothetical protein